MEDLFNRQESGPVTDLRAAGAPAHVSVSTSPEGEWNWWFYQLPMIAIYIPIDRPVFIYGLKDV